jgi:hypothetical protein
MEFYSSEADITVPLPDTLNMRGHQKLDQHRSPNIDPGKSSAKKIQGLIRRHDVASHHWKTCLRKGEHEVSRFMLAPQSKFRLESPANFSQNHYTGPAT